LSSLSCAIALIVLAWLFVAGGGVRAIADQRETARRCRFGRVGRRTPMPLISRPCARSRTAASFPGRGPSRGDGNYASITRARDLPTYLPPIPSVGIPGYRRWSNFAGGHDPGTAGPWRRIGLMSRKKPAAASGSCGSTPCRGLRRGPWSGAAHRVGPWGSPLTTLRPRISGQNGAPVGRKNRATR